MTKLSKSTEVKALDIALLNQSNVAVNAIDDGPFSTQMGGKALIKN